jgi:hypothetical protein
MKFYTYVHMREDDGRVFYVGKGKGARAFSRRGRNPYWHRVVEKHGLRVEIAAQWASEEEAFEHERFLIQCFRDLGYELTNLTDGGEGPAGFHHADETRKKFSQQRRGRQVSEETRAKMSASQKLRGPHPNSIAALYGRPVSQETRDKMSARHKGRIVTQEHRARISATLTGRPLSEEHRARSVAHLASPEVRAKQRAALKGKPWPAARRAAYEKSKVT